MDIFALNPPKTHFVVTTVKQFFLSDYFFKNTIEKENKKLVVDGLFTMYG